MSSTSAGCSDRARRCWRAGRRAARATTSARRWGCSTSCSSSASRASFTTPRETRSWTRSEPRGGSDCDGHGVPRLPARCSGPARGPPPARPSLGHGGPSLPPRSRCARSKRSLGVAFRLRSAHAADDPRTAAFGGSQRSPPFRRIARRRLSLRASERSLRVAFGSPPFTIPMGWQDMHCGVQTVVPPVCPRQ